MSAGEFFSDELIVSSHPDLLETDNVVCGVGELVRYGCESRFAIFGDILETPARGSNKSASSGDDHGGVVTSNYTTGLESQTRRRRSWWADSKREQVDRRLVTEANTATDITVHTQMFE